jgi:uncharacterized membrane protein YkoI
MKRTTRIITVSVAAVALAVGAGTAFAVAGDDSTPVEGDALQSATDAALAETGGGTVTDVEHDDGGYDVDVRLDDGTEIDVDLAADFSIVRTETDGPDDRDEATDDDRDDATDDADDADDVAVDAAERQQAADAALAETGAGTVTDVEHDDGGGYDVEVRLDDGTEIDVDLAADFSVIRTETDD